MLVIGNFGYAPLFPAFAILCASTAVGSMVILAWIDVCRFEIQPECLWLVAATALLALLIAEPPLVVLSSIVVAAILAGVTLTALWLRPSAIGAGDVGLFALIGLLGGPQFAPVLLVLFALFTVIAGASYSLARGKPLFRSMVPAALPAMAAAIPVFIGRVGYALWPESAFGVMANVNAINIIDVTRHATGSVL